MNQTAVCENDSSSLSSVLREGMELNACDQLAGVRGPSKPYLLLSH